MNQEITILTIDDDQEICFALEALFKFQGWRSLSASNMTEGVEQFKIHQPDLVFVDYHMPQINGVEGVRMLRSLSKTVPIIVFTIDESQEVADAFMEAGANDFVIKPVKVPDMVSRIRLHLRLLQQQQTQPNPTVLPKGMTHETLRLVESYLSHATQCLTANQIAQDTGLAYQTTYRYLQYMLQEKIVVAENVYGKVGRPKQLFCLARKKAHITQNKGKASDKNLQES